MLNRPISIRLRLGSMLLDHTLICLILIPPYIFLKKSIGTIHNNLENSFIHIPQTADYLMALVFAFYFCKDCIGSRSIAKRILKLQVVDNKTGQLATPLQCLTRNILIIIWPLEVVISLFNTTRRLGDKLAGTRVTYFDPFQEKQKFKIPQVILSFILAFIISYIIMQLFRYF